MRVICDNHKELKFPPNYLMGIILNYYQNEKIYLICTEVDLRYTDKEKNLMTYQFAADILFETW